uniref:Ribonuclease H-like domain-containing protein n=1 Tax=Tanacetum cinerariifolium TaxID=118510 RepID=A0A6L2KKS4_TANCI|nr:ribonuclease H-like domain-containing protein [Tanacetum cinerariifolium]
MATDENGDPPVPDLRTMKELCQPTLNGRGGPIAPIAIQAMNFGLKNDMIQKVQNSCQFHGLPGDDASKHLDKFLHATQSIKVNGVTDDALRLHRDTINVAAGGTFMKRRPEECYDLIENMTAHHNDWDTSVQQSESSSSITSSFDPVIIALKAEMAEINKNIMKVLQINQQVKAVAHNCETCGGPHSYNDCPATVGQTKNVYAAGAYNLVGNSYQPQGTGLSSPGLLSSDSASPDSSTTNKTSLTNSNLELKNMFGQFMKMNTASSSGSGTLPSNTVTNPKEDLKGITTRSGNAYQGPTILTTSSPHKVVERETEVTKDTVPPTNNESTKDVQPPVVQIETPIPNSELVVAPVAEPVVAPVCFHMHDPREPHLSALKKILRYVQGTLNYGLRLFSSSTTDLVAYYDADWVGCPITRRSTSGYCVFIGNNLLSWSARRQPTLSRSSAEAEYRGVAIAIVETSYKDIEIDIQFVRDLVTAGQIRVLHVPSPYQFTDTFTKGLSSALFEEFRSSLSFRCLSLQLWRSVNLYL